MAVDLITPSVPDTLADVAGRRDREAALTAAILLLFQEEQARLEDGYPAQWERFQRRLAERMSPELAATYTEAARHLADEHDLHFDTEMGRRQARVWSGHYANTLAAELIQSTKDKLVYAHGEAIATGTPFMELIAPVFSPARADVIGTTETTRAITSGMMGFGNHFAVENKLVATWRWYTRFDDRVCEFCMPLHGLIFPDQIPDDYPFSYHLGPPGHVNCRCSVHVTFEAR